MFLACFLLSALPARAALCAGAAPGASRICVVSPRATVIAAVDVDPNVLAGAAAAFLAAGGAFAYNKKDSASAAAGVPPPAPAPKPTERKTPVRKRSGPWPSLGGPSGPHRMAGTLPPPAVRMEWVPPPDWKPPSKPVVSWYDMGTRLEPSPPLPSPVPAAPQGPPPSPFDEFIQGFKALLNGGSASGSTKKRWPSLGGDSGPHRMAGTMPPPPVRVEWDPPAGWKSPSPPPRVSAEDAYAAKKKAYDERRLVLLPPTGANKPKD